MITGTGSLEVAANFADGIVGKDDLWIEAGTIAVSSVDDGIRGTDSLTVTGGTIDVDSALGEGSTFRLNLPATFSSQDIAS